MFALLPRYEIDNIELALQVFNTFTLGAKTDERYKKKVEGFLEESSSRINALERVIELCGKDKSPKALYIKTMAGWFAGASCREKVIQFANEYLQGEVWDGLPKDDICIDGIIRNQKTMNVSQIWLILGQAYEGEYEFESALQAYKKCHELDPFFYGCDLYIARIYKKLNNLDMAIQILEKAKTNPLLKSRKYTDNYGDERTSSDYSNMFDADLEEYRNKKLKGYVYKPRIKRYKSY